MKNNEQTNIQSNQKQQNVSLFKKHIKKIVIGFGALVILAVIAGFLVLSKSTAKDIADEMARILTANGADHMGDITAYTKKTDPDSLLGKDNQYIAKASFNDDRIENAEEAFGVIETFDSLDALELREYYIESVAQVSAQVYEKYGSYGQYSILDQVQFFSEKNALLIIYTTSLDDEAIGLYEDAFKQAMQNYDFKDKDSLTDEELAAEKSKIRMQVEVIVAQIATELEESLNELRAEIEASVSIAEETLDADDLGAAQELVDNAHEDYFSEIKDWKARLNKVEEAIQAGE
jgi:hypothetical protein